jgi:hypothetical protein
MEHSKESAYLFNIHEIQHEEGILFIEFYAGNILDKYSDALVVSSFSKDYYPVQGSILGAIADKFGIEFTDTLPEGVMTFAEKLHKVPVSSCSAFRSLWIVEMRDLEGLGEVTLGDVRRNFAILDKHIIDIVNSGCTSISLPLLGTGYLGLNATEVIDETLRSISKWVSRAPRLQCVRVFAYDIEKIALLNMAIDDFFSYPSIGATQLLLAANSELSHRLNSFVGSSLFPALKELSEVSTSASPSAKSIALEGRKLAEVCAKAFHANAYPGTTPPNNLHETLRMIQGDLNKSSPWIYSYLRLLQACGNSAAHPTNTKVTLVDAAAIVVSALRVAEYAANKS